MRHFTVAGGGSLQRQATAPALQMQQYSDISDLLRAPAAASLVISNGSVFNFNAISAAAASNISFRDNSLASSCHYSSIQHQRLWTPAPNLYTRFGNRQPALHQQAASASATALCASYVRNSFLSFNIHTQYLLLLPRRQR